MKRRTVVTTVAAIAGGFAGCTGLDGNEGGGGDPPLSHTPSPTGTPTESPTPPPTEPSTPTSTPSTPSVSEEITERSFEVVENVCGTGRDEASVERGSGRLTVRGTISGRNSCFTAELERVTYGAGASELTVGARSFSDATEREACGQCLVDIGYRARVSYDAPDPETVTVLHNDETL